MKPGSLSGKKSRYFSTNHFLTPRGVAAARHALEILASQAKRAGREINSHHVFRCGCGSETCLFAREQK